MNTSVELPNDGASSSSSQRAGISDNENSTSALKEISTSVQNIQNPHKDQLKPPTPITLVKDIPHNTNDPHSIEHSEEINIPGVSDLTDNQTVWSDENLKLLVESLERVVNVDYDGLYVNFNIGGKEALDELLETYNQNCESIYYRSEDLITMPQLNDMLSQLSKMEDSLILLEQTPNPTHALNNSPPDKRFSILADRDFTPIHKYISLKKRGRPRRTVPIEWVTKIPNRKKPKVQESIIGSILARVDNGLHFSKRDDEINLIKDLVNKEYIEPEMGSYMIKNVLPFMNQVISEDEELEDKVHLYFQGESFEVKYQDFTPVQLSTETNFALIWPLRRHKNKSVIKRICDQIVIDYSRFLQRYTSRPEVWEFH